jgi:hypothetical protein
MEGVCMSTNTIRSLFTAPAPSLAGLHGLYATLAARYMSKAIDEKVLQAIENAETSINTNTDDAEGAIIQKVEDTCSSSSRRRLGHSAPTFEEFIQSSGAQEAKNHAKSQGLKEGDIDKIFSRLLNAETGHAFQDKLRETVKGDFSDPQKMAFIDEIISKDVEANGATYTGKLAHRLLRDATDKETRKLDGE